MFDMSEDIREMFLTMKEEPAKKLIIKYSKSFEGTLDDPEVIKLVGISRNTYYKTKEI